MPTITKLKTDIQGQIAPGNDAEFMRLIQEADMRLLEMGRWRWCRGRGTLTPVDGYITLPATYASILGVQIGNVPSDIKSEEYEFVPDGVGDIQVGQGYAMLIDQGLNSEGLRHYKVSGSLPTGTVLTALMLYAPVILFDPAAVTDLDEPPPEEAVSSTLCPSQAALKQACLAIIYEEANSLPESQNYFAMAAATLDNLEQNQRGNARAQINMKPVGRGIRGIPSFR